MNIGEREPEAWEWYATMSRAAEECKDEARYRESSLLGRFARLPS